MEELRRVVQSEQEELQRLFSDLRFAVEASLCRLANATVEAPQDVTTLKDLTIDSVREHTYDFGSLASSPTLQPFVLESNDPIPENPFQEAVNNGDRRVSTTSAASAASNASATSAVSEHLLTFEEQLDQLKKQTRCGRKLIGDCPQSICHFCGREGHLARQCHFGQSLEIDDQFILCATRRCVARRFLMPLHQAQRIDHEDLTVGRADVGCRSVTAALCRSESYRRNTEIRLTFCGCDGKLSWDKQVDVDRGDTVVLTGGLLRGLRPDERSVAQRLAATLEAESETGPPNGCRADQGLRRVPGGFRGSLKDCCEGKSLILLLDPEGQHLEEVVQSLARREALDFKQLLILLGDDKGLAPQELEVAEAADVEVIRVSLGKEVLLGSHCIVLVHHYLDRFLHSCPAKLYELPQEVAKSRRQRQARLKRK